MSDDVRVYQRETQLLITLRIAGGPDQQHINSHKRPTFISPEIVDINVVNGTIKWVAVAGPTRRRDGKWGAHRTVSWMWSDADCIPDWVKEVVRLQTFDAGVVSGAVADHA